MHPLLLVAIGLGAAAIIFGDIDDDSKRSGQNDRNRDDRNRGRKPRSNAAKPDKRSRSLKSVSRTPQTKPEQNNAKSDPNGAAVSDVRSGGVGDDISRQSVPAIGEHNQAEQLDAADAEAEKAIVEHEQNVTKENEQ